MDAELNRSRLNKGFQLSKNFTIFLVCLSLAVLFWLLKLLSNSYTTIIEFPVKFVNFPTNKVALNYVPKSLAVMVEAHGYDLVALDLFGAEDSLILDGKHLVTKKKEGEKYSVLPVDLMLREATKEMDNDFLIKEILQDTLPFHFDDRITKTVLVELDIETTFDKQYAQKGELKMRPEAIQITGPKSLLDTIQKLKTLPIRLEKINDNVSLSTQPNIDDNRIELIQKNILVSIEVEKFTEAKTTIPLYYSHKPKGISIKTFPHEVEVTYLVGLSEYGDVSAEDFKAVIDLDQLKASPTKLHVKLEQTPQQVSISRIEPSSVEYIIKK